MLAIPAHIWRFMIVSFPFKWESPSTGMSCWWQTSIGLFKGQVFTNPYMRVLFAQLDIACKSHTIYVPSDSKSLRERSAPSKRGLLLNCRTCLVGIDAHENKNNIAYNRMLNVGHCLTFPTRNNLLIVRFCSGVLLNDTCGWKVKDKLFTTYMYVQCNLV